MAPCFGSHFTQQIQDFMSQNMPFAWEKTHMFLYLFDGVADDDYDYNDYYLLLLYFIIIVIIIIIYSLIIVMTMMAASLSLLWKTYIHGRSDVDLIFGDDNLFWQVYTVDLESRMVEETRSRAQNAGFQNMEAGILKQRIQNQLSADVSLETLEKTNWIVWVFLGLFWVNPQPTLQPEKWWLEVWMLATLQRKSFSQQQQRKT